MFGANMSAAIVSRIADLLSGGGTSGPVSLFAARPDEPDLLALLAHDPSACWLFPRVEGDSIILHQVSATDQLAPGRFGIREPSPDAPIVTPQDVRVFLCPGIAFNSRGIRLGRGGGYYDRLLAARSDDSLAIGVCCESQIFDTIPADPHDIHMDMIVTERRLLRM
jgi:5-formyltetrahydrofolate cyclo-ligase